MRTFCLILTLVTLAACSRPETANAPKAESRSGLTRAEFNALAVRLNLPFFWDQDSNSDSIVDDDEVVRLQFYPAFEGTLDSAHKQLLAARAEAALDESQPEGKRRALVRQDLDAGRPSLVRSDFRTSNENDRAFVRHILAASAIIDQLHNVQLGNAALASQLPKDTESQALFRRNLGPRCVAPQTEKIAECSAIPGSPKTVVDAYPASIDGLAQDAPGFCAKLQQPGRDAKLIDPFTVVREESGKLVAIPLSTAYAESMGAIAKEIDAAVASVDATKEAALVAYLKAAAQAFRDNNWWPADEAWARMGPDNSRWYLRIAPDEVYWDPCGFKAGFALTFAQINQGSLEWQKKLSAVQQDMEVAIATAAGAPYKARKVGFELPDFIDIVSNAGDSRSPLGGVIGQSLPNFGPVAGESRGRTVAMVNLFNEPDSHRNQRASVESLLDRESLADYVDDPLPHNFSTILHEATHNLGPSQNYRVGGKEERAIFGGPISSLMEELKAQTGGWYLIELLRSKGVIDDQLARRTYVNNITWALGHISAGMWSEPGHQRKTYSQLAAIQIGFLLDQGVLSWNPDAMAANGTDRGAFHIHPEKFVDASNAMMKLVGGIKARADRAAAEALAAKYVDTDRIPQALIVERYARLPRASLVYSVDP
ncbi:MAG: hypothetical protein ABW136_00120 [Steroidobacteraceae bacterium]